MSEVANLPLADVQRENGNDTPAGNVEEPEAVTMRRLELEFELRRLQVESEERIALRRIQLESEGSLRSSTGSRVGSQGPVDPLVQCAKVLKGHRLPCDAGVPIWFDEVEKMFLTYRVPDEARVHLIMPALTERVRYLLQNLELENCADYEQTAEARVAAAERAAVAAPARQLRSRLGDSEARALASPWGGIESCPSRLRVVAYRQFARWVWKRLGRHNRTALLVEVWTQFQDREMELLKKSSEENTNVAVIVPWSSTPTRNAILERIKRDDGIITVTVVSLDGEKTISVVSAGKIESSARAEEAYEGAVSTLIGLVLMTNVEDVRCISTTVDVKVTWKAWCDNIVNQDIRPSVAVKNLAIALWGSSVLLQRTVTEVALNASLNKDSRLPLTPKKVAFLRGECKLSHVNVT
ncbi:hypothetical protein HPB47_028443 [Ixodes persulcatus]|uniref:Uncharacterized protein n=1 Tax=Ixodes persulcatus TaxID=34615 RepID=A0AC60PUR9_IXOPE|nr:hypothetical protein HPB47_028443 [Ixodes persulcatus]